MREKLYSVVAKAIKNADNSFFNEDYTKQAVAVLRALNDAGFEVMPMKPSPALLQYVASNMPVGRLKSDEYLEAVYKIFIEKAQKYP